MAMPLAALLALAAAGPTAWAQARPVAAGVASAPAATASAPVGRSGASAGAGLRVIEDDSVRIEETHVRGQVARITVQPKGGSASALKGYEINVGAGGRDPSQDKSGAGQRVWSVLRF